MLKLNNIPAPKGANRQTKRRGRGPGSGQGKTGGRGHKGQKARSGGGVPPWFEGGQMPLNRRLPKRGFTNIFKKSYQLVNLDQLEARFEAGSQVDGTTLVEVGLIKRADRSVKLLGRGALTKTLTVEVDRASKTAIKAVEAAGGSLAIRNTGNPGNKAEE
jgi:large subunit ribosomal protein L15